MKLKIKVTKDVLKRSAKCQSSPWKNCAIATAIREIFPVAGVMNSKIRIDGFPDIFLPEAAQIFIKDFDKLQYSPSSRLNMPELEFEVNIPVELIETINISDIHKSETLEVVCQ